MPKQEKLSDAFGKQAEINSILRGTMQIVGKTLVGVNASSIAVNTTGVGTTTFAAIPGATDYILSVHSADWCNVDNVTRSGNTLTVTFRNVSNTVRNAYARINVIGIKTF